MQANIAESTVEEGNTAMHVQQVVATDMDKYCHAAQGAVTGYEVTTWPWEQAVKSPSSVKHCKIYNCFEVQGLEFKSGPGSLLARVQTVKHWSDRLRLALGLKKTKPCKTSNFKRFMTVCALLNMGALVRAHNIDWLFLSVYSPL